MHGSFATSLIHPPQQEVQAKERILIEFAKATFGAEHGKKTGAG